MRSRILSPVMTVILIASISAAAGAKSKDPQEPVVVKSLTHAGTDVQLGVWPTTSPQTLKPSPCCSILSLPKWDPVFPLAKAARTARSKSSCRLPRGSPLR
jgi:hypothetical protein